MHYTDKEKIENQNKRSDKIAEEIVDRLQDALDKFIQFYALQTKRDLSRIFNPIKYGKRRFNDDETYDLLDFKETIEFKRSSFENPKYSIGIGISDYHADLRLPKFLPRNSDTKGEPYYFLESDIDTDIFDRILVEFASGYMKFRREKLEAAFVGSNASFIPNMEEVLAVFLTHPSMTVEELEKIFNPGMLAIESEGTVTVEALDYDEYDIAAPDYKGVRDDMASEIGKLSEKPGLADIVSFGFTVGNQIRRSNKAVTDWQTQNKLRLPASYQLHKKLSGIVAELIEDGQTAEQKIRILRKASGVVDKMIEVMPNDQSVISEHIRNMGSAKEILDSNAKIAGEMCEAFKTVAPDLKAREHDTGDKKIPEFSASSIDSKLQELEQTKLIYKSKPSTFRAIDEPLMATMLGNFGPMGLMLDAIIETIENASREIAAGNMSDAERHIRKIVSRVSSFSEVIDETEQEIKAITDKTARPLQIEYKPLGGNGDAAIQFARPKRTTP